MEKTTKKFKEILVNNLPGLLAFSITDTKSGQSYIKYNKEPEFGIETIAAFNLQVYKTQLKAVTASIISKPVQEVVLKYDGQFHILKICKNFNFFLYVVVDSTVTDMTVTEDFIDKHCNCWDIDF